MVPGSLPAGCPIRTSAGLCAFAARRSFSQLVTSFIASESLGILHTPLSFRYIFNFIDKRLCFFRLWFARVKLCCVSTLVFSHDL